jgi:hypothetical protein
MEDEPEKTYPPSPARMSKTPSWIMLGFVIGALFVMALPDKEKEEPPPPRPAPVVQPKAMPPRLPPPLSRIESVFAVWGRYAVWDDETTEVALWDPGEERFADYYEIRRIDGVLYFRSIPRLTRRIIARGKPMPESPLQFTESEEQYRAWEERDRRENPFERLWRPAEKVTPAAEPAIAAPSVNIAPPPMEGARPAFEPPSATAGGETGATPSR